MSNDEFKQEYLQQTSTTLTMIGTPRPGMDDEDATARQDTVSKAIWTFSQAAKQSATSLKRRRSLKARTYYCLANCHVELAFGHLQKQIVKTPSMMSQADFKLLKEAMYNFRVKFIVHDSKTIGDLQNMLEETKKQEEVAELETRRMYIDREANIQTYLDAKDKHLDLKVWGTELLKEIRRCQPKPKYTNVGDGLFKYTNTPSDPYGVPSQHAQISPESGFALRNILKPETIRRTFISFHSLTCSIRDDIIAFLTDIQRHSDRTKVIKQIKETIIASRASNKLN
jgi:hypothetical protein